jgi:hypothetical protein
MDLRRVLLTTPAAIGVALAAYLHASAVSALVAAHVFAAPLPPPAVPPSPSSPKARPSKGALLARNPFEHGRNLLAPTERVDGCAGVRVTIAVQSDDHDLSLAALERGGERAVRRRGGEAFGLRVLFVGNDRVLFDDRGARCEARIYPTTEPAATPHERPASLADRVAMVGPDEVHVDRSALDAMVEALTTQRRLRVFPQMAGGRVVGMRLGRIEPGSTMSILGFSSGDRIDAIDGAPVDDANAMLAVYARIRSGAFERLVVRTERGGQQRDVTFVIR